MAAELEKKQTDKKEPRILKTAALTLALILAILLLSLGIIKINDLIRRSEDLKIAEKYGLYDPVDVGGHSLNLVSYGEDSGHTIVFISGLAVEDMSVTYRDMTDILAEDNRIVFIDRAGYGLSSDSLEPMTVEKIVSDYRTALDKRGIKGPYVLAAHSLGGVYATYWESMYPQEIEAVAFLDSTQLRKDIFPQGKLINEHSKAEIILNKTGLHRIAQGKINDSFPAGASLNDEDLSQTLSYLIATESLWNFAMDSEFDLIGDNCNKTWDSIVGNDIPKTYICATWASEEQEYKDARNEILIPYLEKMGNCDLVMLPGVHLIYEQRPVECAKAIGDLLQRI